MKFVALLIGFLIGYNAFADEWLCTTESGQRVGNTILACGIGDSLNDEGLSRKKALQNAIEEFRTICELSNDCRGRQFNIEPKRTSCLIDKVGLTKCYRLIEVRLEQ